VGLHLLAIINNIHFSIMKKYILRFIVFFLLFSPFIGNSHQPDQSFIYVRVFEEDGIEGRFELNVNQLNTILGYDFEKHPMVADILPYQQQIEAYILENSSFVSSLGKHNIIFTNEISLISSTTFGAFVQFHFYLDNVDVIPDEIEVTYNVFLDKSQNHMNYLTTEYNWKAGFINNEAVFTLDFSKGNATKTWDLSDGSLWKGFMAMIRQGVWHIWIGLDHILFLVALILPSVVRRIKNQEFGEDTKSKKFNIFGWKPVEKFYPAFLYIVKIVTFFTLAHTITLSLAALQLVVLPSRIVETVIAFSIGLAAYHNIRPIFKGKDWIIAFVFGLFHGFGFASVLGDLGYGGENLVLSLLGFNIGVEIGQVVIIALIFPLLYFMRNLKMYPKFLVVMSILLIVISLNWVLERGFEIDTGLDYLMRKTRFEFARWLGLR
jgi:hypothetical protein